MKAECCAKGVYKIKADSNCYVILDDEPFVIDTGNRKNNALLLSQIHSIIDPLKIKKVIFTHLHYDHIGNFDIFKNATFYASQQEKDDLFSDRQGTVLDREMEGIFKVPIIPASDFGRWKILPCPGHTKGSISIWNPETGVLFSGDTIFYNRGIGRTDLPTSDPSHLDETLHTLESLGAKLLCPGHEY